jgi:hypothetical protein
MSVNFGIVVYIQKCWMYAYFILEYIAQILGYVGPLWYLTLHAYEITYSLKRLIM